MVGQDTRSHLALPKLCPEWSLLDLLWHLNESVAVLREAIGQYCVFPEPVSPDPLDVHDVLRTFDRETARLLAACVRPGYLGDTGVAVGRHLVRGAGVRPASPHTRLAGT